jgi:translation initiation factor 3 subunit M
MAISQQKQTQPQLVFVEGTFEELALEMAEYLHIAADIQPLIEKQQKEDVLNKLVQSSGALNSIPEKEYTAASNLMTYLVLHSQDPKKYLQTLCGTFSKPLTNAPVNGVGLSLNALTTVFNLLPPDSQVRFRVFMEILKFLKQHTLWESLRPYLPYVSQWADTWNIGEEFERKLYEEISDVAAEAGQEEYATAPLHRTAEVSVTNVDIGRVTNTS